MDRRSHVLQCCFQLVVVAVDHPLPHQEGAGAVLLNVSEGGHLLEGRHQGGGHRCLLHHEGDILLQGGGQGTPGPRLAALDSRA